jgi:hypothetical protein
MAATRQDHSGVFDADLAPRTSRAAATLDRGFELTSKGITFVSDEYLPEWTEVGVEMRLPDQDNQRPATSQIDCRGVVVQCSRRPQNAGFDVALLFLDLPKSAQARLQSPLADEWPASISISR